MPALECTNCGLTYGRATAAHALLSSTGAACPRCSSRLALATGAPAASRRDGSERHDAAVRQSVVWAEEAASEGDYAGALAWLATVEAVGDELSEALAARRRGWSARLRSDAVPAGHPAP